MLDQLRTGDAHPDVPVAGEVYRGAVKRIIDLVLVVGLAPVWVTLYALIAAIVLLVDGRPLHHRALRIGQDGQEFRMLKFRSMVKGAEDALDKLLADDPGLAAEYESNAKLKADPRVTRLGRFLRRSSLDELPQLWHVLTGTMTLVGPRPAFPGEREKFYGSHAPRVFTMRPGITGPWQVSGRSLLPFDRRVSLEVDYATSCGPWTDLKILVRTVPSIFRGHGAY